MGTIAWQYGQVGDWNFTRLGRGAASTSVSKLPESRTTSFEESPEGVAGLVGDDVPPPPQPTARRAATARNADQRLTPELLRAASRGVSVA